MLQQTIAEVSASIHAASQAAPIPMTARKRKAYIFDLDHTTIDSSHRVNPCLDEAGNLDLEKYIAEACTEEKIMRDGLLPLAKYMQALIKAGEKVIVLTARHCSNADYVFLRKNGLRPTIHLSRDQLPRIFGSEAAHMIYYLGDAAYKRHYVDYLFQSMPDHDFVFFDDHDGVLEMAAKRGIRAIDAKIMNDLLELQLADMYEQGYQDGETDNLALVEALIDAGSCLA